ncbi:MAG TPA: 50S ribosomal protein L25 [Bacteroidales bacterium]|nr:50S ribosomal protein L25 [Bacteroidales bacterium]HPS61527.1 50S ribosomal protein L25 [Bacteroidales bacterium]
MKKVSLSGTLRAYVGKKDAKMHRKDAKVPCVMYGGKEQIHFVIDEKTLLKAMHSPIVYIFELNIDGKVHQTTVQDVQYHPVTDRMLHVDFKEIVPEKPVTIGVPIRITGTAPGVLRGGKLIKKMRKLVVKALVQHLPDEVTVSIDTLDIGSSVKVSDMNLENITFIDPPSSVIATVRTARTVVEEAAPGAEGAPAAEGAAAAAPAKK